MKRSAFPICSFRSSKWFRLVANTKQRFDAKCIKKLLSFIRAALEEQEEEGMAKWKKKEKI